jgi:myosin heavy subunit
LKLGEIEFTDKNFDESGVPCEIVNQDILKEICELLGMDDKSALEKEIVNKQPTRDVAIRTPLKLVDCNDARDSLAKDLYNKMF